MKKCYSTGAVTMTVGAMLLGAAASASALEVKSGNDNVSLKLFGHINRAVMSVDDGNESKVFHVDNTHSESRVGLKGKVEASENLTIGANAVIQWQGNPSEQVSMANESVSAELVEREMEVFFDFSSIGKFSLGSGKMASDETSEVDLSGTDLAGNSGMADAGGGFAFYDTKAKPVAEGEEAKSITVGNVFNQMDGLSKKDRVRYDTPSLAGFSLGVSLGEKEMADAALRYSGDFGGTKLKAAVAYSDPGEGKDYSQINGSASLLFNFGLNFTVASGARDLDDMPADGDDPTFTYGKIGYKTKIFSVGSTACSFDYGMFENIKKQDTEQEGTAYGVQFVQKFSDYNTELFAAYRNFELDDNTGADYESITLALAGARVKF